jgi:hypothetical protein
LFKCDNELIRGFDLGNEGGYLSKICDWVVPAAMLNVQLAVLKGSPPTVKIRLNNRNKGEFKTPATNTNTN